MQNEFLIEHQKYRCQIGITPTENDIIFVEKRIKKDGFLSRLLCCVFCDYSSQRSIEST